MSYCKPGLGDPLTPLLMCDALLRFGSYDEPPDSRTERRPIRSRIFVHSMRYARFTNMLQVFRGQYDTHCESLCHVPRRPSITHRYTSWSFNFYLAPLFTYLLTPTLATSQSAPNKGSEPCTSSADCACLVYQTCIPNMVGLRNRMKRPAAQ